MVNTLSRRRFVPLVLTGILLLVGSVMVPVPAGATLTTFTYTGNTFTDISGTFPDPPGIGDYVTVQFTIDTPFFTIPKFTFDCGPVHLSESTPGANIYANVGAIDSTTGLPTVWYISVDSQNHGYAFFTQSNPLNGGWFYQDFVRYWDDTANVLAYGLVQTAGTWQAEPASTVPLPPAALLLGTGLIPLAWFRRRNRLGK